MNEADHARDRRVEVVRLEAEELNSYASINPTASFNLSHTLCACVCGTYPSWLTSHVLGLLWDPRSSPLEGLVAPGVDE